MENWKHYTVDTTAWPMVIILGGTNITVEACEEYGAIVESLMKRPGMFSVVAYSPGKVKMDAAARKAMGAWESSRAAELSKKMTGLALVFDSKALFALAGLVAWLSPPPYPKRCFQTLDEAKAWARSLREPARASANGAD